MSYRGTEIRSTRELGKKLNDARQRLGLSQAQLAAILGVSYSALSRWEHGNRNPKSTHVELISRWLVQVK